MHSLGFYEKEPQTYKAEKFNKAIERTKAAIQGVNESSLKEEDKKQLLSKMKELFHPQL